MTTIIEVWTVFCTYLAAVNINQAYGMCFFSVMSDTLEESKKVERGGGGGRGGTLVLLYGVFPSPPFEFLRFWALYNP